MNGQSLIAWWLGGAGRSSPFIARGRGGVGRASPLLSGTDPERAAFSDHNPSKQVPMNLSSRSLPLALIAVLGSAACGDSQPTNPPPGPAGPTPTTAVSVRDNSFQPSNNSVTAGETVTWTWAGNNLHSVTFDDMTVGNSTTKSTGVFNRTFPTAGEFTYFCSVHGGAVMSGKVTVN
jgi:plastocyanin